MSSYPYSNFDTGGETDILNVTGIDNNILVKDSDGAITSTFLTNNEPRGSIDFAEHINIVGLGTTAGYGTSLQIENDSVRIGKNPSIAPGTSNVAIGNDAQAVGNFAVAIGFETRATMSSATALGKSCVASGVFSLANGTNCTASGSLACALGVNSTASAPNSFVLGTGASAGGVNSISIGNATNNTGTEHSIAIGTLATNLNNITKSISVGYFSGCKSINGIAIGNTASVETIASNSISMGVTTKTRAEKSIAIGHAAEVTALSNNGIAIGSSSVASGGSSICVGEGSSAGNTNAISVGTGATATAQNSITIGSGQITSAGTDSISIGLGTLTSAVRCVTIGKEASCTVRDSIAIGFGVTAEGAASFCMGTQCGSTSAGTGAIVMGFDSVASHSGAIVIGTGANGNSVYSTRTGLFINPVSEKTPDTNYSNVHYDTSTFEMYRSQYQLGLLLNRDITVDTTLTDDDLKGRVIRITATGGITVTLPQCFDGANCVIINGSNHNHTLTKLSGNTLNYNATTLSLQTSKRVHHVYGLVRTTGGGLTLRDWYVD